MDTNPTTIPAILSTASARANPRARSPIAHSFARSRNNPLTTANNLSTDNSPSVTISAAPAATNASAFFR